MSDPVNKPSHYNAGEVETIDGIRAALGEGFADYCRGNVIKYVWRCGLKGDAVEEGNCPVIPDSSNSKPLAIPSGWRELEPDEVPLATDMHEWMGGWFFRNNDATHEYKWHDIRHIRKIEPSNPSETPNSSTWVPKVGDKVRLLKGFSENIGKTGVVQKVDERIKDVFLIDFGGFVEGWYSTHDVQLIEAAS